MLSFRSSFSHLTSFLILLFHLGCFTFSSSHHRPRHSFKKKLTPPKTTLLSFLKNLFCSSSSSKAIPHRPPSIPSPSSSTRSLRLNPSITIVPSEDHINHSVLIHPCSLCGEIFQTSTLLQHHQSTKHPVSELIDGENIVRIIFNMGWPDKVRSPTIHRILKIHNSPKTVSRFEEYRNWVKSRAESKTFKNTLRDERCIADGNELLRFYCTTFICDLDSSLCNQQYCSACGIIRNGFSDKMDGISMLATSWRAHMAIPDDLEAEFSFMRVKRAMLLCRVIAGRFGFEPGLVDKEDPGFDSLVGHGSGGCDDNELLVFNPMALLPCFVIVYTV